jgi:hypothetical protein
MGATRADLSLGVGREIARPALRPRLAGETRHLHTKQVPRARGPQAASWLRRQSTHFGLNFYAFKLFRSGFMLWIIVGSLNLLRVGETQTRSSFAFPPRLAGYLLRVLDITMRQRSGLLPFVLSLPHDTPKLEVGL